MNLLLDGVTGFFCLGPALLLQLQCDNWRCCGRSALFRLREATAFADSHFVSVFCFAMQFFDAVINIRMASV